MVTIGIVGLGYWGPNYVRVFNSLPESEVRYCCDIDNEILQNVKISNRPLKVTSDYQDLLSDPEVEAVVISTPASTHYQLAKECLEQGKDALVEKPFTLSSKEAEELVELARERIEYIYPYLAPSGITNTPVIAVTIHREDVNRIATECIKAIDQNATGIFCVDLKENKDGVPCPTEINAERFFTTSYFFTKAGINSAVIMSN